MKPILVNTGLAIWIYILLESVPGADGRKKINLRRRKLLPPASPEEAPDEQPQAVVTAPPVPIPTTPDAVISQRLGGNVRTTKYNDQYYIGQNGGPVSTGDDLECNFEGYGCWDNVKSPTDGFDWSFATGQPDSTKFAQNFGITRKPNGRYLIAAQPRSPSTKEAMFISCTVTCTTRPIGVQFRHWTTEGVLLQVCSSETFFNEDNKVQLINCKDVKRNTSPGPVTVSIPPGEFLDIVFVASNFQNQWGGVAIIDDITVDITPCPNKQRGGKVTPAHS